VNMFSFQRDGSGDWEFRNGGNILSTGTSSNLGTWRLNIGGTAFIYEPSTVYVGEVIMYSEDVPATDVARIETYLAIKYGQTLPNNYMAADGSTTVYDISSYGNDIAGIGRDDTTDLNQKVSKSGKADAVITMATDNDFTSSNLAGSRTALSNGQYLVWGNDDGTLRFETKTSLTTATAAWNRKWKIANTGSVGTVYIQFDSNLQNGTIYYLLSDADSDFTDGNSSIVTSGTASGGQVVFTSPALSNNSYITLGLAQGPGGVANHVAQWFKADQGANGTTWRDISLPAEDGTVSGAFISIGGQDYNYNPFYSFDGNNDYIDIADINEDWSAGTSFYCVARPTVTKTYARFLDIANGEGVDNLIFCRTGATSNVQTTFYDPDWTLAATGNELVNNQLAIYQTKNNGSTASIAVDGTTAISGAGQLASNVNRTLNYIARSNWGGDEYFQGGMSEVIIYNSDHTTSEKSRIESYLAIKYGITLGHNYVASDGTTTVWTLGGGYDNDIAGIGRDDKSSLGQVQSKSINSDALVWIEAVGEGINATPAWVDIADKEFLCWGNNNVSYISWTTTAAPPAAWRLARQWRVSESNGDVGLVTVSVETTDIPPGWVDKIILMTDTDGDFTSGAVFNPMTDNSGTWEVQINLVDTSFFTFGYIVPTPSVTPTITDTYTRTPTISPTSTESATLTPSPTISLTATESVTMSPTSTISPTPTISASVTPTKTISATITRTVTLTTTATVTPTMTSTTSPTLEVAATDLSQVIVFPNPYKGDTNLRDEMIFFNMPTRAVLRLYSIDGRLVKTIVKDDAGNRVVWGLNNEQGSAVASGVYIYIIKTNAQERRGKIAIMR
jgi:Concanavalin A-like lectin/glucanases superfamily